MADVIFDYRIATVSKVNGIEVAEGALHSVLTNDTVDSVALNYFYDDDFANLSRYTYFSNISFYFMANFVVIVQLTC